MIEAKHNVALVYCKNHRCNDALKILNKVKAIVIDMLGNDRPEAAKVLAHSGEDSV